MKQSALLRSIALMAACVCGSPSALAVPITYNITFTSFGGGPPTSGSFTFDNVSNTFSAFNVVWAGLTFDETASANAPFIQVVNPCAGGSGALGAFDALTGVGCGARVFRRWEAAPTLSGGSHFALFITDPPVDELAIFRVVGVGAGKDASGAGSFAVAAAGHSVPEPATLGLLSLGLAGVGFARRKRKT